MSDPTDHEASTTETSAPTVHVTRAGRAWVAIILGIVLLALLLVFIFQNLHDTTIHYFTANGSLPVALALLFAALGGAGLVLLVGSVRIIQLRRGVRSSYRAGRHDRDRERATHEQAQTSVAPGTEER